MKNKVLILLMFGILVNLVNADTIEQNDYIIFTCNNATSGELLCTSATIDLYDSSGNLAVDGASATNIATGKFKYQVKNSTGRYTAVIDCCSGAIDYAFPVYVTPYTETKAGYLDASISSRSTLTASDNIGVNLNDVSGTLDASEIGNNAITADKIAADAITSSELATSAADEIADEVWNEPRSEHTTDGTFGGDALDNDIWTDTKAGYLDASISSRSTLTVSDNIGVNLNDVTGTLDLNELGYSPALQSNLTQGIVILSSTTETQIDNIEADTNELQTNQNWNVWDDGTRTLTACPCSGWATPTDVDNACISESELNTSHGTCDYCTATGFSTHSAADVYSYFTSGSNEDVFKADVSSLATESTLNEVKAKTDKLQFDTSNYTKVRVYAIEDAVLTAAKFASDFWSSLQGYVWNATTRLLTGFTASWIDSEAISEAELNSAHGSGAYDTGLTSGQNTTLYNIYAVVGEKDKYDQSIVDMLGYNSSEGNVETDLDSAGGTTPQAVYTYFTDSGRALNETNGWLSNVTGHPGDFDQTIAEMLNYNASEGNVETDLDSAGGTTPEAVWSYSTRTITGGNLTNPDDYKADVSNLATQSDISNLQSYGDSNWATATGFATPSDITSAKNDIIDHGDLYWNTSTLTASNIWSYATRTLTNYSGVWSVAERTLTAFSFAVNLSNDALNDLADSVWDETQSGHTTSGTFGYYLDSQVSSIEATTNNTAIANAVWDYSMTTNRSAGDTVNDTYMYLFVWGGRW